MQLGVARTLRSLPRHVIGARIGWSSYFGAILLVAIVVSWFHGQRLIENFAEHYGIDRSQVTVFSLDVWTGPLIRNIAEHGDYRACYENDKVGEDWTVGLCMSAARMPVIPLLGALSAEINPSLLFFTFARDILFFGVAALAIWAVTRSSPVNLIFFLAINAALFLNPINLSVISQPAAEESLLFALLALLMAVLLSRLHQLRKGETTALYFGVGVLLALLPMVKSSGITTALAVSASLLLFVRPKRLVPLVPLVIVFATILGWGAFVAYKTGHFAFGGSMSSVNTFEFYKGHNDEFYRLYPAYHTDEEIVTWDHSLTDEWDFDRYFMRRALEYIVEHPAETAWGVLLKFYVALLKLTPQLRPSVSRAATPYDLRYWLYVTGFVVNRIVVWAGLLTAGMTIWQTLRTTGLRGTLTDNPAFGSALFLLIAAAWLLPHLAGFASDKHMVPLYFAAAVFLLWRHAMAGTDPKYG